MSRAVFVARDARERRRLLRHLGLALDYLINAENDETSLYLWGLYSDGYDGGYDAGHRRGVEDGLQSAWDQFYGRGASDVAARVKGRRASRKGGRR